MSESDRLGNEAHDPLHGPIHQHDGHPTIDCTQRHVVEPLDDRTSGYLRGLTAEQIVTQHDHAADGLKEGEVALEVMLRMRVFCEQRGFHTHGMATTTTNGVGGGARIYNTSPMAHHHHDLRCLIEAGANQVRPLLKKAEESADKWRQRYEGQRSINERLRATEAHLTAENARLRAANKDLVAFMDTMPAVVTSSRTTVREQYAAWAEEQAAASSLEVAQGLTAPGSRWVLRADVNQEITSDAYRRGTVTVMWQGDEYISLPAQVISDYGLLSHHLAEEAERDG